MIDESVHNEETLFVSNIYSITVRSCLLLHGYHTGSRDMLSFLRKSFWHLANYAAKAPACPENETTFQKMARKVVGHFRKKMSHQVNTPYLLSDHHLLCDYMRMIEVRPF